MTNFIILAIVAVIALILILKLLKVSVKIIFRLAINAVVGLVVLFLLNLIPGLDIPMTWWSGLIVGFGGVPGAIIMVIISFII